MVLLTMHDRSSLRDPAQGRESSVSSLSRPTADAVERLARALAGTAIERDRRGGTARAERDLIRASGLLGLSIPPAFGGAGAPWTETLAVVRRLARSDGSLAHLFGFHHLLVATVAGMDRFWRNLRTHTLHDPVDYRLHELGLWSLNDTLPTPSFYS